MHNLISGSQFTLYLALQQPAEGRQIDEVVCCCQDETEQLVSSKIPPSACSHESSRAAELVEPHRDAHSDRVSWRSVVKYCMTDLPRILGCPVFRTFLESTAIVSSPTFLTFFDLLILSYRPHRSLHTSSTSSCYCIIRSPSYGVPTVTKMPRKDVGLSRCSSHHHLVHVNLRALCPFSLPGPGP